MTKATLNVRTACKMELSMDESTGMVFPLTPCCFASGKGSVAFDGESAVVCRNCYHEVSDIYGAVAVVESDLAEVMTDFGCPSPAGCAEHTMWHFELLQEQKEEAFAL